MGRTLCWHVLGGCPARIRAAALAAALTLGVAAPGAAEQGPAVDESSRPVFTEIWAYLLRGEEDELTGAEPITDLCYVGAYLTREGRITDKVSRPAITLKDGLQPQVHLVIAETSNYALMHFALDPEYGVTPLLIEDIVRLAEGFDGVQIDFEAVARGDAEYFFAFLKGLRSRLPAWKRLSVAAPARTGPVADAYDYSRLSAIVDRLVIMAYDEHWSGSSPGPVASLPWCSKVADFAGNVIERRKIVMGLPLYGRAWQDKQLAKALRFSAVQDLVDDTQIASSYASELGAWFEYSENVVVTVFYEDHRSLMEKLQLYKTRDIPSVSFWRVGLGPLELWETVDNAIHAAGSTAADLSARPPAKGGRLLAK